MPKTPNREASTPWRVSVDGRDPVTVADGPLDIRELPDGTYSLLVPQGPPDAGTAFAKTHHIAVESLDLRARTMTLRVDGRLHDVSLRSPLDQLVDELGLKAEPAPELGEINAPMPGLVLRVEVKPGQEVEAGQTLLVLEAMKMENAIKAPAAGIVEAVLVEEGVAVEKGAALVSF